MFAIHSSYRAARCPMISHVHCSANFNRHLVSVLNRHGKRPDYAGEAMNSVLATRHLSPSRSTHGHIYQSPSYPPPKPQVNAIKRKPHLYKTLKQCYSVMKESCVRRILLTPVGEPRSSCGRRCLGPGRVGTGRAWGGAGSLP